MSGQSTPSQPEDPRVAARRAATADWIRIGDGDLAAAETIGAVRETNEPFSAAFHAQQAAEKYLKAILLWNDVPVPYKHDLDAVQDSVPASAARTKRLGGLSALTVYAVEERYRVTSGNPMDVVAPLDWDDVEGAIATAKAVREVVLADLADAGWRIPAL